jgi:predicted chitinase
MANYLDTLSGTAKANAAILINDMRAAGITNQFTQAAILDVISKESGFIPKRESFAYKTPADLVRVFGIDLGTAQKLFGNPTAIADYVYGPIHNPHLGNGPNDGHKYPGMGYNQITGLANYKKYGQIVGVDLVNNPERMNEPDIASKVAIAFFRNGIIALNSMGKLAGYHATNINDFKNATDSLGAIYHINAGVGHDKAFLDKDVTHGKAIAESRIAEILNYVQGGVSTAIKSNTGKAIMFFFALSVVGTGIYLYTKAK